MSRLCVIGEFNASSDNHSKRPKKDPGLRPQTGDLVKVCCLEIRAKQQGQLEVSYRRRRRHYHSERHHRLGHLR